MTFLTMQLLVNSPKDIYDIIPCVDVLRIIIFFLNVECVRMVFVKHKYSIVVYLVGRL